MMDFKLKPCPFCGSESVDTEWTMRSGAVVYCKDCGIEGPRAKDNEDAGYAWNMRKETGDDVKYGYTDGKEPNLMYCTVREAEHEEYGYVEYHLECRFDDDQKFAAVKIDGEFHGLANLVSNLLNEACKEHLEAYKKKRTA
jgi:Lar family restriction alleviation protein